MKRGLLLVSMLCFGGFMHAQTIVKIAGGTAGYSGDGGMADTAKLFLVSGITVDESGNLYLADYFNNAIRKITKFTNIITTVAGTGDIGHSGDGGPATSATLYKPWCTALDDSGNIYIAEYYNNRIRKVTKATGIISTLAGDTFSGFKGDGMISDSAWLSGPNGVAVDHAGNVYISDTYNERIRKIDAVTHIITTIAGTGYVNGNGGGYNGDNIKATTAWLNNPSNIAVDNDGNVYIADAGNNRIRKVNASDNMITTIAGTGVTGYNGDSVNVDTAQLNNPGGITLDKQGNIYFTEVNGERVRKINMATGIITNVAGTGVLGKSSNSGPADSAKFHFPTSVAVDSIGNIYIADWVNNRIMEIAIDVPTGSKSIVPTAEVYLFPVPTDGNVLLQLAGNGYKLVSVCDITGREVYSKVLSENKSDVQLPVDLSRNANGIYIIRITSAHGIITREVIKN